MKIDQQKIQKIFENGLMRSDADWVTVEGVFYRTDRISRATALHGVYAIQMFLN